jgi:hypothetical protein
VRPLGVVPTETVDVPWESASHEQSISHEKRVYQIEPYPWNQNGSLRQVRNSLAPYLQTHVLGDGSAKIGHAFG